MNNPAIKKYLTHFEYVMRDVISNVNIPAKRLHDALLYSLFSGGKKIRPLLVYLCGEITNAPMDALDTIAIAIELMHCYSLIHDDLPAMDNDLLRRGKPSCHIQFDEATAILVGDGMQCLAIEVLLTRLFGKIDNEKIIKITKELTNAAGLSGMISGQSLDLTELTKNNLSSEKLTFIHQLKTSRLFMASINMAILAGNTTDKSKKLLQEFAVILGVVFQMQDDYNDQYTSSTISGKNQHSDVANKKTTFASLYKQQELLDLINEFYNKIFIMLNSLDANSNNLRDLVMLLHNRTM